MKKIAYSVLLVMITIAAFSQPVTSVLPATASIIHYKLSVGYNTTTVLIFPAPVKQVNRGERDMLAQKQPGVENVLKIKAAWKDFPLTNLHVFTADGRVYAFDVSYTADPVQTTYDLGKIQAISNSDDNAKDRINLSIKPLDREELTRNIAKIKGARPFFSAHSRKNKMKVKLQTIYRAGNILFLGLKINNRYRLPYSIDFTKLYIQDKRRARRSSIQQRDIIQLYTDTVSTIQGESEVKWVVAIPQMTNPTSRQLVWEIEEKNGGRHLALKVKNRQLFRAREL